MRYERYDMGEISNHELKMKLTSYSAKDKPLLLSAILKRREEQT